MKNYYFIAGLPRSGSTLLSNILGQNPRFHVTPTSGVVDLLLYTRNSWNKNAAFLAMPRAESQQRQLGVLRGILDGYFSIAPQAVCFDKNRLWLEYLEMAGAILGGAERVKVIVTVRDLRDVLASFERVYRSTSGLSQVPFDANDNFGTKTTLQRVQLFIDNSQAVGRAYNAIRDAVTRGWLDNMHFVEYEQLTRHPAETLEGIYRFLGEAPAQHQFSAVEQLTQEDDLFHGFDDLHTIRPRVAPQPPSWPKVFDRTVRDSKTWTDIEKVATFWRAYQSREALPPGELHRHDSNAEQLVGAAPTVSTSTGMPQ